MKKGVQKMRSKKKTASTASKAVPRVMPRFAVMPFKRSDFGEKISNMPQEAKIVGALLLMLAALYVFQVISQPSFLKSQVNTITGLVVSDSEEQTGPTTTATTTTTTTTTAAAPKQQPQPTATVSVAAPKIVEPAKGSTVSPGFTVKFELPTEALTCYYQTRDNGEVKWDRRMKPCRTEISVEKGYCSTVGKNTCYIVVEAYDGNGNGFGSDSAYYSIQ